ncbi:hypothetical protein AAC387_Pa05g3271 [Persea americana]
MDNSTPTTDSQIQVYQESANIAVTESLPQSIQMPVMYFSQHMPIMHPSHQSQQMPMIYFSQQVPIMHSMQYLQHPATEQIPFIGVTDSSSHSVEMPVHSSQHVHSSSTSATQKESGASSTVRSFIPDVEEEITPRVGMLMDSIEEAYDLYNTYAKVAGFSVRKSSDARRMISTQRNESVNAFIKQLNTEKDGLCYFVLRRNCPVLLNRAIVQDAANSQVPMMNMRLHFSWCERRTNLIQADAND